MKKTLTKRVRQTVSKINVITKLLLTSTNMTIYAICVELNEMLPVWYPSIMCFPVFIFWNNCSIKKQNKTRG